MSTFGHLVMLGLASVLAWKAIRSLRLGTIDGFATPTRSGRPGQFWFAIIVLILTAASLIFFHLPPLIGLDVHGWK